MGVLFAALERATRTKLHARGENPHASRQHEARSSCACVTFSPSERRPLRPMCRLALLPLGVPMNKRASPHPS